MNDTCFEDAHEGWLTLALYKLYGYPCTTAPRSERSDHLVNHFHVEVAFPPPFELEGLQACMLAWRKSPWELKAAIAHAPPMDLAVAALVTRRMECPACVVLIHVQTPSLIMPT